MSGQELTPSSFFGSSSRRTTMDERVSILESQVQTVIDRLSTFKSRTQGQLQQTEQEKWDVFEWINEADANLKGLNQKCENSFGELNGKVDSLATTLQGEVEELLKKLKFETNKVRHKGDTDKEQLKKLMEILDKQCKRVEDKTGEEIRRESAEREAFIQRIVEILDKKKEEEKEFKEEVESIVEYKQDDREVFKKEMSQLIDEKQDEIEARLKSAFESSVGELQHTLKRAIAEYENKLVGMACDVQEVKDEMAKAPPIAAPTSSVPHTTFPIVPPTPLAPRHVSSVKWTKNLTKLRHKEVRNFVSLFKSFQAASGMSEDELKLTLLQSLDGDALQLIAPVAEMSTVTEILERLLNRVRPSQSILLKKLMETRQKVRESVYDFGARFQAISSELPTYSDSRIRDMLIESLNETWKMTARSLVMANPHIAVEELLHKLMELEGTDAADRMEIDHVSMLKRPQYEEMDGYREVGQVVVNGRINWDEVRDLRTLMFAWRQGMRSDNAFRRDCMSWINQRPSNPNMQRNGFRPPHVNRPRPPPPNRRIFNVREQPEPEFEIAEDDVFEEEEHLCCASQVVPKQPVKVIHRSSSMPVRSVKHSTSKRTPQKSYLAAATSGSKNPPLMFLRARLNGNACDALIDTGSQVSIIPYHKIKKWGMSYDENRKQVLCGFDGNESESEGVATVDVKIGNEKFKHDFVVVSAPKAKLIFGNDIMKAQGLLIDPASHQIQTKNDLVVPCHHVDKSSNIAQPSSSSHGWKIKSVEPILVQPVVKDDVVLIPAGKSFALGAKTSKTMILPLTTSQSVQFLDANRLPPGIVTSAGVWMQDQRLRLTISNTTSRSVMIGSKAAIAGVMTLNDRTPQLVDQTGKDRELRRV